MSCGGHWPSYYLYRHLFSGNAILYYFIYQIIGLYTCLLVLYCYSEGVFRFDSGSLKDLAAELDRWKTQLDYRGPIARTWAGRLRRDLEAEEVAASTSMECIPVTVAEVHRILVGDRPPETREEDAALVRGYRDAMSFVLRRADDAAFSWDRELFVGLHDRIMAG